MRNPASWTRNRISPGATLADIEVALALFRSIDGMIDIWG
jgi:hypothetical protein